MAHASLLLPCLCCLSFLKGSLVHQLLLLPLHSQHLNYSKQLHYGALSQEHTAAASRQDMWIVMLTENRKLKRNLPKSVKFWQEKLIYPEQFLKGGTQWGVFHLFVRRGECRQVQHSVKDMTPHRRLGRVWTQERDADNPKSKPQWQRGRRLCRWGDGHRSNGNSPRTCTFPGEPDEKAKSPSYCVLWLPSGTNFRWCLKAGEILLGQES